MAKSKITEQFEKEFVTPFESEADRIRRKSKTSAMGQMVQEILSQQQPPQAEAEPAPAPPPPPPPKPPKAEPPARKPNKYVATFINPKDKSTEPLGKRVVRLRTSHHNAIRKILIDANCSSTKLSEYISKVIEMHLETYKKEIQELANHENQ